MLDWGFGEGFAVGIGCGKFVEKIFVVDMGGLNGRLDYIFNKRIVSVGDTSEISKLFHGDF